MLITKSNKVLISLILLIASTAILCAVNPAPILTLYKILYVKYVRIAKGDFTTRFSNAQLDDAITHAKGQGWVQKQIASDLAPFKRGIDHKQIDAWFKTMQHPDKNKLVKFSVENSLVTTEASAFLKQSRSYKTVYSVVSLLASRGQIPNCEFLVALNDYLDYVPTNITAPVPIFTFAKHSQIPIEKDTILIPDWMNVRYWDVLRGRIALASKLYPWHSKKDVIHWRGGIADSMRHRAKLIGLKSKYKFLDVGMTEGANAVPYVDPENSLLYKYQISLDGSRCTWERMIWQMSANTLLIKPRSPQVQWFHLGLVPYENYVPIQDVNEENIAAVYAWLQENDQEAKQISQNANQFARDNFKTQDFFAYYAVLLQEYSKLML